MNKLNERVYCLTEEVEALGRAEQSLVLRAMRTQELFDEMLRRLQHGELPDASTIELYGDVNVKNERKLKLKLWAAAVNAIVKELTER